MKKQKSRYGLSEEFPELDELVLREIQAMVPNGSHESLPKEQNPDDRSRANPVRPHREKPKPARRPEPEAEEFPMDEPGWDKATDLTSSAPNELLSPEEQQFVTKTVEWLRTRGNRDTIMASVWSQVIDSDPDSFYSPETEETPGDTTPLEKNPESFEQR
jgi:hypothetical protein